MEQISSVIPFGDTTDPKKVAKKLPKSCSFVNGISRREDRGNDEGVAATTLPLWVGQRSGRMLVKDLKVGAMYRLQSFGAPGKYNFGHFPNFEDCMVSILNGPVSATSLFTWEPRRLNTRRAPTIDATRRTHGVLGCLATRLCQSHRTFGLTLNQWRKHESI